MEVWATSLLTYGGFPYLPPINVVNKFQPAKTDAKLEHIDYASDALGKVKNKLWAYAWCNNVVEYPRK